VIQKPNRPDLLQGTGVARDTGSPEEDRLRADNGAKAEILNEIRTTVTSTLQSFYREESRDGKVISSTEAVTKISAQYAQETIEGIKIADRYYDKQKKLYYSYASITRQQLEDQFRQKAESAVKLCADYHRLAQTALSQGGVYDAMGNYIKALGELFIAQAYLKKKIEGSLEGKGSSEMLQPRLENELTGIISRLQFQVINGDGQRAQRDRPLEQPLVGRVVYQKPSGEIPATGLPVTLCLTNATGDMSSGIVTGKDGGFTGRVNIIRSASAEVGTVRAGLDLGELEPFRSELKGVFARLEQVGCDFRFQIDVAASVRIFVSIYEEVDGNTIPKPFTTGVLIKSLVQNSFTVIETDRLEPGSDREVEAAVRLGDDQAVLRATRGSADYAVVGRVTSQSGADSGIGITFAFASADVRVIDLQTGRVLTSSVQSRVKGGGGDAVSANRAAIAKCADEAASSIINGLKQALR
jgi:hypothetical protein